MAKKGVRDNKNYLMKYQYQDDGDKGTVGFDSEMDAIDGAMGFITAAFSSNDCDQYNGQCRVRVEDRFGRFVAGYRIDSKGRACVVKR